MKRLNIVFKQIIAVAFLAALVCTTGCSSSKIQKNSVSANQLRLDPEVKTGKLENGISYFILENAEPKNRINLRLVVKAGSILEDDDQKGIAHFTEHMCFNGTKNFEKFAIVDFFESIGMKWGPEVNAYTSFDETVYTIDIPADNLDVIKKSFLVLHDWANAVTFEDEEIDKERGVVIEEIRTRTKGISGRSFRKTFNFMTQNSRYAESFVLGNEETIKNLSYERIKDFYRKWYKPELMSVIAVGDIKASVLEKELKAAMSVIPASENPVNRPYYKLSVSKDKKVEILKDKEAKIQELYIYDVNPDYAPVTTVEDFKYTIARNFAARAFNNRIYELTVKPDALWTDAGIYSDSFTDNSNMGVMYFYPKFGKFNEAFKVFIDEYERFIANGITESELARLKENEYESLKQSLKNKNKITTNSKANGIENTILGRDLYLSMDDYYKHVWNFVGEITAEDVINSFKERYKRPGNYLYVVSPEDKELPSEKEIKNIWLNYESEASKTQYVDEIGDGILMVRPSEKGKIVSKKAIKELGATQYTFENGVKLITKKTNFTKDSFAFYAGSKGGYYLYDEKDVPSAKSSISYSMCSGFAGKNITQINKILSTKNIDLEIGFNATSEKISGGGNKNSFEVLLQLTNLVFTKPDFTEDGWKILMDAYNQQTENYGATPGDVFSEKLNEVIYGKNLYYAPFNKDYLKTLNAETSEKIFKERFGNAADFTFVVVGDFDEKYVLDMCSYYLGTLKTNNNFEQTKYVYFPFPEKSQTITVNKGIDNKGQVYMCFGGELPPAENMEEGYKESFLIDQLNSLLNTKLYEIIREDKSGTYNISTGAFIDGWPERFYQVRISFNTDPEREEELQQAVLQTIEDIKNGNVTDEMITKLREGFLRSYETALRNNYWWLERIKAEVLFTYEPMWNSKADKTLVSYITKEAMIEAANKYLNSDRLVTGFLKPEKK